MVKQNDPYLNMNSKIDFSNYGCALFGICNYAVMFGSYIFKHEAFLEHCEEMRNKLVITNDAFINSWSKVVSAFGLPYKLVIEDGTHKLKRKPVSNEIQLLYLFDPESGYHHFVCADNDDNITYDSLGSSSTVGNAYKEGRALIVNRRIFRKV